MHTKARSLRLGSIYYAMSDKRISTAGVGVTSELERLPDGITINEILLKLELDALCTLACVSKTLRSLVSQSLLSLTSLDLSAFSPDTQTLNQFHGRLGKVTRTTLDCLCLDDASVVHFLGPHLQELILFKCSNSLSYRILSSIGQHCPNLRVLILELTGRGAPSIFEKNLVQLLKGCSLLESLCIKIRGLGITEVDASGFISISTFLPKTVKFLKLQPVLESHAIRFMHEIDSSSNLGIPCFPGSLSLILKCVSLVLDIITDDLVFSIMNSLPLLVELDLEDRPRVKPSLPHDLSNSGLQSLGRCKHLTGLSLIRSRQNCNVNFKEASDMGMFLLSEGCKGLESIRLGGFSRVSDAGFASILNSCLNLKKIEIHTATLLSDLAFHKISKLPRSFVEVRLVSCSSITSESVEELASSSMLEVLDLLGCRSVSDSCITIISSLHALTSLNFGGADVTDSGMAVLGKGCTPIARLCLRGCKRITDRGIALLLHGGGKISKTLSLLDLGHMPRITDRAIVTLAADARAITDLCIRYCFNVTDASLKVLALERTLEGTKVSRIRRLDLHYCVGLSDQSFELLKKPLFPGLHWVGIGLTQMTIDFAKIREERPWLTVCSNGCEIGCHDGWQFH